MPPAHTRGEDVSGRALPDMRDSLGTDPPRGKTPSCDAHDDEPEDGSGQNSAESSDASATS